MLRRSLACYNYRAQVELDRIRGMLRGRARLERKIGLKRLFFLMRTQTRYRVEQRSFWNRAIVRKNVDTAAREHGSGWPYLRNDLARQNIALLPKTQQTLALYEPLAFRSIIELCASRIPPPPPPATAMIPEEAYISHPLDQQKAHPAAQAELRRSITNILQNNSVLTQQGSTARSVQAWEEAWRDFLVEEER